jgi:hypothetical protein
MPSLSARLLLLCLLLMAATHRVHAQEPVRGTVLHIDGDEIVIDLGRNQLERATGLTVYRTLEVRHPVTRKLLRDRFVIGSLQVIQPGDSLSVSRVSGTPSHPIAVGDTVEFTPPSIDATKAVSETPSRLQPQAAPSPPAAATSRTSANPAETEVLSYWYASLSQPPDKRAQLYATYLQRNPESSYRQFIQNEVTYLRGLDVMLRTRSRAASPAEAWITMKPLTGATAGRHVELAARVRSVGEVRALILHVMPLEAHSYRSVRMELDARGHARAQVPDELVRAPGFAYFIEAVGGEGKPIATLGTVNEPKIAVVRGPAPKPQRPERATRVRFSSEVASFDAVSGRDYFMVNEGDFMYRVRRGPLYAVRMGYGSLIGEGGTVQQLDVERLAPRPAGFSYGFFEAELELDRLLGAAIRGTIGLGRPDDPLSQRQGITGGVQLRARIGEAEGTHLVLAGELMPEIGQRAYIGLAWEAIERLPMSAEIVVTDQPVNSDELAVRLIFETGYRFTDRFSVALRPSYQLRTIRHAGPGIGMAATFDW